MIKTWLCDYNAQFGGDKQSQKYFVLVIKTQKLGREEIVNYIKESMIKTWLCDYIVQFGGQKHILRKKYSLCMYGH